MPNRTTSRRPHSRGFDPGQRRLTEWALGPGGDDIGTFDRLAISDTTSAILGTGVQLVGGAARVTVVRIRGFLELQLVTANAAQAGFNFVCGIGIFTVDAFSTGGVTSLPAPFDDIEWPGWMWLGMGTLTTALGSLAVGDPDPNPLRIPIDVKAMRMLRKNEVLGTVIQTGEIGTCVMDVTTITRMLVKLA